MWRDDKSRKQQQEALMKTELATAADTTNTLVTCKSIATQSTFLIAAAAYKQQFVNKNSSSSSSSGAPGASWGVCP
jgi:hypothetical protein